ncbi:MAG: endonuclease/exonuclease/phosphatase family protein [bacterium]|nr:endonuclease/exonuclease/phosphatase family protein [bacterium]
MIKIISLNIEQDQRLNLILPFFRERKPDVLLLQEVFEKDLDKLSRFLDMPFVFAPMCRYHKDPSQVPQVLGLAVFTKLKVLSKNTFYYFGGKGVLPLITLPRPEKMWRAIIKITVEKDGDQFCLVNTHFTWTPDGMPNARQKRDLRKMLDLLSDIPEVILCGDFNAPRGREIFDQLAKVYKDNIPQNITTTIDQNLHRRKNLQLVVDGLFTTERYEVQDVEVVPGVSDHCAIVAHVTMK